MRPAFDMLVMDDPSLADAEDLETAERVRFFGTAKNWIKRGTIQ